MLYNCARCLIFFTNTNVGCCYKNLNSFSSCRLDDRTFDTCGFYRSHEDEMVPVGMSFFQSQWDSSVQTVYHNTLSKLFGRWGSVSGL